MGQDLGPSFAAGSKFAYEPDMFPALMRQFSNIVLARHNYGAYHLYTTPEKYSAYLDKLAAAGIPMVSGEFGYTYDGSSTAYGYEYNHPGGNAVFDINPSRGIGILWWQATGEDKYVLVAGRVRLLLRDVPRLPPLRGRAAVVGHLSSGGVKPSELASRESLPDHTCRKSTL